jgi:DNA-binding MurR/RpiR family transcriptional regulator
MPSFEARIREVRPELSPSFQVLADFLLDSYDQAAFLSGTELAHRLDVDPATVVRFAQRLGYPGYRELQREVQARVLELITPPEIAPANSPQEAAVGALEQASSLIDQVRRDFPLEAAGRFIKLLDRAARVVILAEGLTLPAARTLGAWLELGGHTVHYSAGSAADLARALAGVHRGDLVIAIECDGETPILGRALQEASKHGGATVALVASPSHDVTSYADLVLATRANSDPVMAQLMLDALTFALVRMLMKARPGRFKADGHQLRELTRSLAGQDGSGSRA